jgi:hypothetical protein
MEGTPQPGSESSQAREYAIGRLKAKRDFKSLLGSAVVVTAIMVAIWALSDGGYFWPVWVMFGFGIALLFGAGAPTARPRARSPRTRSGARWRSSRRRARQDSNLRLPPPEGGALSTELRALSDQV